MRTYEHLLPLDILIANGRSDMKLACESFGSFCNLKKDNIKSLVASENNHISKIISEYLLTTSVNYISLDTQCKPFAPFHWSTIQLITSATYSYQGYAWLPLSLAVPNLQPTTTRNKSSSHHEYMLIYTPSL